MSIENLTELLKIPLSQQTPESLKSNQVWDSLSPFEQGTILAKVWGSVKA